MDARARKKGKYPPISSVKEWPIFRISRRRKEFHEQIINQLCKQLIKQHSSHALMKYLEDTVYKEKRRIIKNPWRVDPKDDKVYWEDMQRRLTVLSHKTGDAHRQAVEQLLRRLMQRYLNEIGIRFRRGAFQFVRRLSVAYFIRLLSGMHVGRPRSPISWKVVSEKVKVYGDIEKVRALAKQGTVVVLPSHQSNFDPLLVGFVLYFLGFPPFMYGAGLNLFNVKFTAYCLRSVGAYTIDRRKTNFVYLETIMGYTREAIKHGCNIIFFPGGTRSRSGGIEKRLKMGLLSALISSQREVLQEGGTKKKIFVVPIVLSYHFIFEAASLIKEYLQKEGQEKYYLEKEDASASLKLLRFITKLFTKDSKMVFSICPPTDVLGNEINDKGESIGNHGKVLDIAEYFSDISADKVTENKQRESHYARLLGQCVTGKYHKYYHVLSSHVVAFVLFEMIRKKHPRLDLYSILRLQEEETTIPYADFVLVTGTVRDKILSKAKKGQLRADDVLTQTVDCLVEEGISQCGLYHALRPIKRRKKQGSVVTQDITLLYYYHNRLSGYDLHSYI